LQFPDTADIQHLNSIIIPMLLEDGLTSPLIHEPEQLSSPIFLSQRRV